MALGSMAVSKRSGRIFPEDHHQPKMISPQNRKSTLEQLEEGESNRQEEGEKKDRERHTATRRGSSIESSHSSMTTITSEDQIPFDEYSQEMIFRKPSEPVEGQPLNFGIVVPGVYRSSYPQIRDYAYMRRLKLKTIVTLVNKEFPEGFQTFITENGIKHHVFNMMGTKKAEIPLKTMKSILRLVLDQKNHPLLIHCNHGKHRTGCVVAVVRKACGWELESVINEYTHYAEPKVRECDVKYITAFELSSLSNLFAKDSSFPMRATNFLVLSLFSFVSMVVWFFTGSRIATQKQEKIP